MPEVAAVSAIVLAAGLSRRAAPHNKLLLPAPDASGRPVIRATVEAACAAGFDELIVVTGHDQTSVETALAGLDVRFVHAADFAEGMGRSLAAGAAVVSLGTAGVAVIPGDLPLLASATIRAVLGAFREGGAKRHVIPTFQGQRGHPVVMGAWLRSRMCGLVGDVGARGLLDEPAERAKTLHFSVEDSGVVRDFDRGPVS